MTTISGTPGNDNLVGTSGADSITGLGGDDWLSGGAGNDTIDGGANGTYGDNVDYSSALAGINVDLVTCIATDGLGGTDLVFNVEHVNASAFDDTLLGNSLGNWFRPFEGNDSVDGRGGQDVVFYESASSGVTVNLQAGTASGAGIGNDTLTSIEALHGSSFADAITLSNTSGGYTFMRGGDDLATGGSADDGFIGGSGDDTMHGGTGFDVLNYDDDSNDPATATGQGVSVNLATGTATDNWGDTDTFTSMESVNGSDYADLLVGGNPANGSGTTDGFEGFNGNGGSDTIDGGAGFDRATYQTSPAAINVTLGGTGSGTAQDGFGGTDTLINIEEVRGSNYNDTLTGSSSGVFESFEGRSGNDTINGGGGTDRATFGSSPAAVNANLATGTATDGWGGTDTLIDVDNLRGSEYNDTLTGDDNANDLEGRGGNDSLVAGAGADTLRGGLGNDTLDGGSQESPANTASENSEFDVALFTEAAAVTVILGADGTAGTATGQGNDVLIGIEFVGGSALNDFISGTNRIDREIIRGGLGDDTLSGGHSSGIDAGFDHVSYNTASGGVTVNLASGTASGADGNDVLSGFEGVIGSEFGDAITGSAENGYFEPRGGNDTIDGGAGSDRLSYWGATAGVHADIAAGQSSGGGGNDVFTNIENLRGSEFADTLLGDDGNNDIQGRGGNDFISLGVGQDSAYGGLGDDTLDGGANDPLLGNDWLIYSVVSNAVNVNLAAGTATGEGSDVFANFEAVSGSAFGDTLTGDAFDNVLRGNAGSDTIDGGAGNDWVDYGGASGAVTVSLASGTSSGADGADTFTNVERIRGSTYADVLTGDGADNVLRGNAGDDTLTGGAGNDAVDYYLATGPVSVNLAAGTASGADGSDSFSGFEHAWGSFNWGDTLVGNAGANHLDGLGGADSLSASDGNDTLQGGDGDDTLDGGAGFDTAVFTGAIADYTITYDPLDDTRIVVDGPEGHDILIGIEALRFADGTFAFESGTDEDDELDGGDADEVISGRAGHDRVRGGGGNDALYGDDGDDDLQGDQGDDLLDGGTGADTMAGGEGDDTYAVDSAADVVVEPDAIASMPSGVGAQVSVGGGIDRVIASIDYTLGSALENLTLAAAAGALTGSGNGLANAMAGNESDNVLTGGGGNDTIDGGAGIDTAAYAGNRSQYTVALGATDTVGANGTGEGTDTLAGVERLRFADGGLAIDIHGNAGEVAKIMAMVFGPASVGVPSLATIGLSLRDGSFGYEALMDLALDVALGEDATSAEYVTLFYTGIFGTAPDAGTRDFFAGWLDQGLFTPAQLGVLAADIMGVPSAAQNGLAFA